MKKRKKRRSFIHRIGGWTRLLWITGMAFVWLLVGWVVLRTISGIALGDFDWWFFDDLFQGVWAVIGASEFLLGPLAMLSVTKDRETLGTEKERKFLKIRMVINVFFCVISYLSMCVAILFKATKKELFPDELWRYDRLQSLYIRLFVFGFFGVALTTFFVNRKLNEEVRVTEGWLSFREWWHRKKYEMKLEERYLKEILTKCGLTTSKYQIDGRMGRNLFNRSGLLKKGARVKLNSCDFLEGLYGQKVFQTAHIGIGSLRDQKKRVVGKFWVMSSVEDLGCELYIFNDELMSRLEKSNIGAQKLQTNDKNLQSFVPEDVASLSDCLCLSNNPERAQELISFELEERIQKYREEHPSEAFFFGVNHFDVFFFDFQENGIMLDLQENACRTLWSRNRAYRAFLNSERKLESKKDLEQRVILKCINKVRYTADVLNMMATESESIMYNPANSVDVDEILLEYRLKADELKEETYGDDWPEYPEKKHKKERKETDPLSELPVRRK